MYLFLLAGSVTIYMLTTLSLRRVHTKNSCTQTEETLVKDIFTQTEFMDICSSTPSDFSDPFDIDMDFFKANKEF